MYEGSYKQGILNRIAYNMIEKDAVTDSEKNQIGDTKNMKSESLALYQNALPDIKIPVVNNSRLSFEEMAVNFQGDKIVVSEEIHDFDLGKGVVTY